MSKKQIEIGGFEQALLCAGLVHYKHKSKKVHPATEKAIKKLQEKLDCGGR